MRGQTGKQRALLGIESDFITTQTPTHQEDTQL